MAAVMAIVAVLRPRVEGGLLAREVREDGETQRGRATEDGRREKSIAMLRTTSRPCPKKWRPKKCAIAGMVGVPFRRNGGGVE